jgi:hypothetical protein
MHREISDLLSITKVSRTIDIPTHVSIDSYRVRPDYAARRPARTKPPMRLYRCRVVDRDRQGRLGCL